MKRNIWKWFRQLVSPKRIAKELWKPEEEASFEKAISERYQWKRESFTNVCLLHLARLPVQAQREGVSLTVDRKMLIQQNQNKEEIAGVNRKIRAMETEARKFGQKVSQMELKLKMAEKREQEGTYLRQKQTRNLETDLERAVKKLREEMDERERAYKRRTEILELHSRRQIERQTEMAETQIYRRLERELLNEKRRRGL